MFVARPGRFRFQSQLQRQSVCGSGGGWCGNATIAPTLLGLVQRFIGTPKCVAGVFGLAAVSDANRHCHAQRRIHGGKAQNWSMQAVKAPSCTMSI